MPNNVSDCFPNKYFYELSKEIINKEMIKAYSLRFNSKSYEEYFWKNILEVYDKIQNVNYN